MSRFTEVFKINFVVIPANLSRPSGAMSVRRGGGNSNTGFFY